MKLTNFEIVGLFGDRNISLPLEKDALILVGPNGLGKSSVVNIFYLTLSRQWRRLLEYTFHELALTIDGQRFSLRRTDISGLIEIQKILSTSSTSRTSEMVRKLIKADVLERFVATEELTTSDRREFANLLGTPLSEVRLFQRHLLTRFSSENELFTAPRAALEEQLTSAIPSRVLYLPTYRRIEKDLREIFPEFEDRYRRNVEGARLEAGRLGNYYVELVSFGMEDVRKNISLVMQELRDYSLAQYNNLSASYLRDVIRGQAANYTAREINSLDDKDITKILDRVSETTLSAADKRVLRSKIKNMQNKKKSLTAIEDRFLAHYFSLLVAVTNDISKREEDISSFVSVCNGYLKPGKSLKYDEVLFALEVVDDKGSKLDLSVLSSGEKQIVSIFSHLYLDKNRDQIVVIDEPELSLSVPWQRKFLPDIIASGRAPFLIAVTHSPFIFDNELKPLAHDLREFTVGT